MSEDNSHERRSRTRRTRPGPEGRIAKKKKRARPVLGSVNLYHSRTGEVRAFHPVDANVQLKAGTYTQTPPSKGKASKPVQTRSDDKSKIKEAMPQAKPEPDPRSEAPESPHQAAIAKSTDKAKKPVNAPGAA